jgi:hypothetical protein
MNVKSLILNTTFISLWCFSMFLVYNHNYARSGSDELLEYRTTSSPEIGDQRWFDVCINGKKIGYAMNSFSKSSLGYVFKDYSLLRIPMAGVLREVLMDFYAVVDHDFSLKSFTFGLTSGDYSTDIFGQVNGMYLELKVQSIDDHSSLALPAGGGIYFPGTVPLLLASKGFPDGKFTLPGFDPFTLTRSSIEVNVGEKQQIRVGGKSYEAYQVIVTTLGVTSTMWVTADGAVVKEEESAGMSMALTTKQKALDIPDISLEWDVLGSLAVGVDVEIENPREVTYLKVELIGIEPTGFNLDGDFQRVVSAVPLVLEISSEELLPYERQSPDSGQLDRFTKPEAFIQSDDPRIVHQAKLVEADLDDDSLKIVALTDWVYSNIEKDLSISLPSAVDVLRVRRGDCNEHTFLFTAMARAMAIPTKICMGIVYKDGLFYYHAWPAVYIDRRWLPVDPTFGQHIADATHIKLLEGGVESQAGLMRVVGNLSVRVINYSISKTVAEKR